MSRKDKYGDVGTLQLNCGNPCNNCIYLEHCDEYYSSKK